MPRRTRGGDPYWTQARFAGTCSRCEQPIRPGQRIFHFPNGGKTLCEREPCGPQASRDFASALMDESWTF